MGKKKNNVDLYFIGNNASGVTGSVIFGKFYDYILKRDINFLLEMGGVQDKSILENYRANLSTIEKINAKEIDFVFIGHEHVDHIMLVPSLVRNGFKGKIICTKEAARLCIPLWYDCCFINKTEVEWLQSRKGIKAKQFYYESDVAETSNYLYEYDLNKNYDISPCISIRLIGNRHILGSCSAEIFFKDENSHVKKLFYSSDLGNTSVEKHFINQEQKPHKTSNVAIYESTYSTPSELKIDKKLRKQEIKLLEKTIKDTLLGRQGNVVIPCFSMDRSQNVLAIIKDIFDRNESLKDCQVVLDGRLTSKITEVYREVLQGDDKVLIEELVNWENLRRVTEYKVTRAICADKKPKVIISSSGFIQNGHILEYIKSNIKSERNTVVFCGYSPEGSIASKMKAKEQKYIKVDNGNFEFKCEVLELHSFSSHIQNNQLLNYISQSNVEKIVLVHGEHREELAEAVKDKLSSMNKTSNVIVPKKGSMLSF